MNRTILDPSTLEPGSSIARVAKAAGDLGLSIEIARMEQSTRTAEEAADACGCATGQIVKSLIFENAATGGLALILVAGSHNADLDHLKAAYGLELKRCDARKVRDETGFAIGGVAPIGHLTKVPVYFDTALLAHDVVWAAAGRPDSVFSVDPRALAEKTGARVVQVRGGLAEVKA